ncbi:DUF4079 family protein [Candidatus Entotheonella palauensis]|uniref:Cytochrome b561 domain-containing protein n=1 Tax=Candidatus Entotheonella gemina TaxID=1429439 RepID=W4MCI7_9BACT|nr:DUF4079 family protein [Candidatus Entotheonella palauensis]ETX07646.1 MAG: hypothetical protein ETSY2_10035 [Candidatus Entotheonella gemina]
MKTILAYIHPILQVLVLVIAFAALRLGLALKKYRGRSGVFHNQHEIITRHMQLGYITVAALSGGYLLGLISMPWLRGRAPFGSAHFFFATMALILFLGGAYTGWRMKHGTKRFSDVRDIHGFLAYLAVFVSLGAGVMGFILLP